MKYSFVIPTYNNKILLKNTLEALNYQPGFGHYEVIVVDDGSSDDTYEYIKGTARNYKLRYYYLERCRESCRSRTRNYGWKNAKGDIIAFIDSDIIVKTDYLFELERCFSISEDIVVIGNRLLLNDKTDLRDIMNCDIFEKYRFDSGNLDILEFRYLIFQFLSFNAASINRPWMQVYSCNMAVPKKLLEKIGGFDENFKGWGVEDIEFGYSMFKKGVKIVINSKLEVLHQSHGIRNDLVIKKENIERYNQNIEYFLSKYPEALGMPREKAYKYLRGEETEEKPENPNLRYIGIDFKEKKNLKCLKKLVLSSMKKRNLVVVVNDYVENTDLDIWLQLLKCNVNSAARYFPMSKKIEIETAVEYLKNEKERQRRAEDLKNGNSPLQEMFGNGWERRIIGKTDPVPQREHFRYDWVKKNFAGKKILEIGCSSGYGTKYLNGIEGLDYLGIDYDKAVIDLAVKEFGEPGRIRFENHDVHEYVEYMDKNNMRYDTIIALEILEHIPDGLAISQKLKKYCDNLLISMPYNERKGYWGLYHLIHGIKESDLYDFHIVFLYDDGTISDRPGGSESDLMLALWKKHDFTKIKVKIYAGLVCPRRSLDYKKLERYFNMNGCKIAEKPEEATHIILVTCGFIDRNIRESFELINVLIKYKGKLIVAGCLYNIVKERLTDLFKGDILTTRHIERIDELFPDFPYKWGNIPDVNSTHNYEEIIGLIGNRKEMIEEFFYDRNKFEDREHNFLIRIGEGCNFNCTYCSHKNAIGRLHSKGIDECIKEFKTGYRLGYRLFRITSMDIGSYGTDINLTFPILLNRMLSEAEDIQFVLEDINPVWLYKYEKDLLPVIERKKIKMIQLPSQSGSTEILKKMHRWHDVGKLIKILKSIKKVDPGILLATEIIAGFPTETSADFRDTMKFLKRAQIGFSYIYPYFENENIESFKIKPKCDKKIIDRRLEEAKNFCRKNLISYSIMLNRKKDK